MTGTDGIGAAFSGFRSSWLSGLPDLSCLFYTLTRLSGLETDIPTHTVGQFHSVPSPMVFLPSYWYIRSAGSFLKKGYLSGQLSV